MRKANAILSPLERVTSSAANRLGAFRPRTGGDTRAASYWGRKLHAPRKPSKCIHCSRSRNMNAKRRRWPIWESLDKF